jgi:hypothetical protein
MRCCGAAVTAACYCCCCHLLRCCCSTHNPSIACCVSMPSHPCCAVLAGRALRSSRLGPSRRALQGGELLVSHNGRQQRVDMSAKNSKASCFAAFYAGGWRCRLMLAALRLVTCAAVPPAGSCLPQCELMPPPAALQTASTGSCHSGAGTELPSHTIRCTRAGALRRQRSQ